MGLDGTGLYARRNLYLEEEIMGDYSPASDGEMDDFSSVRMGRPDTDCIVWREARQERVGSCKEYAIAKRGNGNGRVHRENVCMHIYIALVKKKKRAWNSN